MKITFQFSLFIIFVVQYLVMLNGVYLAIVLLVAFLAIAVGFRNGITRQIASLLGLAFGTVAARVLSPQFSSSFLWVERFTPDPYFNDFAVNLVCSVSIYLVVFFCFNFLSGIFSGALSVFRVGMFNRLLGGFFSLVKNLLWLSIIFNLLICFHSESQLLRYERSNDGNLVAAVMEITPAILGCYGGEDFAHFHQLKEAKSISCNSWRSHNIDCLSTFLCHECYINTRIIK